MKPYYLLGSNGVVRYFLFWVLLVSLDQLQAQVSLYRDVQVKDFPVNKVKGRFSTGDTLDFHQFSFRFQNEVGKRGDLNLD